LASADRDIPKSDKNQPKRHKKVAIVGLSIFVLVLIGDFLGVFHSFDTGLFDLQTRVWRRDKAMPQDVVLILIDEASLSAMEPISGRWPWRRDIFADVIDFLTASGARKIVFDILFTESSSADAARLDPQDAALVSATAGSGHVVHACQLVQDSPDKLRQKLAEKLPSSWNINQYKIVEDHGKRKLYNTAYWPFAALRSAAAGIGVTSFSPDADGVFRRAELFFRYQNADVPALALVPLLDPKQPTTFTFTPDALMVGGAPGLPNAIPLDEASDYWVNLYGRYTAFSFSGVYLSLLRMRQGDLTHMPVQPDQFKNKIVFIGASAAGVEDLKTTALGRQTPGVLLHASIYSNLVTNDMLHHAPGWAKNVMLLLAVMATAAAVFYYRHPGTQVLLTMGVFMVVAMVGTLLFRLGWLIAVAPTLCAVCGTYIAAQTWISFATGQEKRKIRNILGQYVSPAILSSVLANHKEALLNAEVGQRRLLTLQFSDIRGFTSIAELLPEEQVVALLNGYLGSMVDVIFSYQGTLDKFIGDAILAFWGAPIMDQDHAFKAVCCALDMQKALASLNDKNIQAGLPLLRTGLGIHTDEVILGNIGSCKKLDYTVIGDGVNLASRLESLTKTYRCPILISAPTYAAVRSRICCRVVDKVQVKGKQRSIMIYEALARMETADAPILKMARLTDEAHSYYCHRRFSQAAAAYRAILALKPTDGLSPVFVDRCNQYVQAPPAPAWEGECVYDHK
jgi:adenylate cyclase